MKKILIFILILIIAVPIFLLLRRFGAIRSLLIVLNVVTFTVWSWDKYLAKRKAWRVPEIILLGLTSVGGTPGAIIGQLVFNHKSRKKSFLIVFYAIALLQGIILTIWML